MLAIDVSIPNRTVARRYADWTVATPLEYTRRVSKKITFRPRGSRGNTLDKQSRGLSSNPGRGKNGFKIRDEQWRDL